MLAAVSAKVGGPAGIALLLAGVLLGVWRLVRARYVLSSVFLLLASLKLSDTNVYEP